MARTATSNMLDGLEHGDTVMTQNASGRGYRGQIVNWTTVQTMRGTERWPIVEYTVGPRTYRSSFNPRHTIAVARPSK